MTATLPAACREKVRGRTAPAGWALSGFLIFGNIDLFGFVLPK
jgi:hypothetical protein